MIELKLDELRPGCATREIMEQTLTKDTLYSFAADPLVLSENCAPSQESQTRPLLHLIANYGLPTMRTRH